MTIQIHDGASWADSSGITVNDGSSWGDSSSIAVHNGSDWIDVSTGVGDELYRAEASKTAFYNNAGGGDLGGWWDWALYVGTHNSKELGISTSNFYCTPAYPQGSQKVITNHLGANVIGLFVASRNYIPGSSYQGIQITLDREINQDVLFGYFSFIGTDPNTGEEISMNLGLSGLKGTGLPTGEANWPKNIYISATSGGRYPSKPYACIYPDPDIEKCVVKITTKPLPILPETEVAKFLGGVNAI